MIVCAISILPSKALECPVLLTWSGEQRRRGYGSLLGLLYLPPSYSISPVTIITFCHITLATALTFDLFCATPATSRKFFVLCQSCNCLCEQCLQPLSHFSYCVKHLQLQCILDLLWTYNYQNLSSILSWTQDVNCLFIYLLFFSLILTGWTSHETCWKMIYSHFFLVTPTWARVLLFERAG